MVLNVHAADGRRIGRTRTRRWWRPTFPARDPQSFVPIVRACLQALLKPIDNACEMFNRPALANDIQRMFARVVGIMGL
jgi:hypothetical protein